MGNFQRVHLARLDPELGIGIRLGTVFVDRCHTVIVSSSAYKPWNVVVPYLRMLDIHMSDHASC